MPTVQEEAGEHREKPGIGKESGTPQRNIVFRSRP
jgi:hypothetical protein